MNPDRSAGVQLPLADELTTAFARMSGLLLSQETVDTVLGLITSLAVETVPGSMGAGVTLIDAVGHRTTSAATDPLVERADALQYELDEGPCLAAAAGRQVVRMDDVAADRRWPRWSAEAAPLGLRSVLSSPMVAGDVCHGALKVYALTTGAFDAHAEQVLTLFSAQAAILVANMRAREQSDRFSDGLRQAVGSRDTVNVAKGVLMARHGVDEDTAFDILLGRARQDADTLHAAARGIVASAVRRRR